MVKRRDPQKSVALNVKHEPTIEQVEAFAAAADGGSVTTSIPLPPSEAKGKKFKSLTISFIQQDFEQLHEAAKKAGRSKLSFIRRAIQEKADALLIRNEKDI
jgi:hypothetical protein